MISRQSASLLAAAGLADWVAADEEELVGKAVQWARDTGALQDLRAALT